ncbi:MAG TPA: hypothetical protein DEF47_11035 [Herpetosiphon sp.]|uniref:Uncharacterized protein n=1 Tax=Herpetosiphon aurantiacus (strain ATCC 23779 / DSM 785 / 114-95) TaxID=316274 RepID=A9AXW1_HERA2|nr:hypothetical protein [Herpetosiphon sp.]ABX04927.1 hypothetical protein Haur_2287 [Herpetosiphon aurantiacus DSM 785]HBW50430.1 hypothetical protein [Herpetosiphon sp.]
METLFFGIILVVIGLIVASHLAYLSKQEEAKQRSKQRYQQALHDARKNPQDPRLENAARLHRKRYIELLEAEQRQRLRDEQPISRDIETEIAQVKQLAAIANRKPNQNPTSYAEWQQHNQQK